MKVVIAVGGNALLKKGESLDAKNLKKNCEIAAKSIAKIALTHQVVIVHGNGPQVGLLSLQADAYKQVKPYPFDFLDAESQGMIGYSLQQALFNEINPDKAIATLLTQVVVDKNDPAFHTATKPIGPFYSEQEIIDLIKKTSWQFKKVGKEYRRVVPSPAPQEIIELAAIQTLLLNNNIVITGGGGGIPCIMDNNKLQGVEAVIDKDLTASKLAVELKADAFVILTDVDAVYSHWGTDHAKAISKLSSSDVSFEEFEAGSMKPKLEAACGFATQTGSKSYIGHLDKLEAILSGESGTQIS